MPTFFAARIKPDAVTPELERNIKWMLGRSFVRYDCMLTWPGQDSVYFYHIVGTCPVMNSYDANGEMNDVTPTEFDRNSITYFMDKLGLTEDQVYIRTWAVDPPFQCPCQTHNELQRPS